MLNDSRQPTNPYYAWGVCGFLLLAIGLIYGQTLGHVLLDYDDNVYVFLNPHVRPGLTGDGIWWAFTDGPFGEWYPLAMLSHMLDCQVYGLNAWGHHLTNVLLHAAASIALFLVLWRMTDELWPSAFVAAIFAIHPQHVESVAWVAERRDVLSGLFFVLTLGAYLGYVRNGRSIPRYLVTLVLLALGLMTKPMLVTLPPLLMLLDFWPLARFGLASDTPRWTQTVKRPSTLGLMLEKIPFFALVAAGCAITLWTHHGGPAPRPWSARIGNAAVSCVTYIVQFFLPLDLVVFYPEPTGGFPTGKVAGAIGLLAAVSVATLIWRRRCPYGFVGWLWYLGMLSPVLGLVGVADHLMADRYMYLPGIGLYIALGWGLARASSKLPEREWVLGTGAALLMLTLIACAAWQTSFWRDEETLWRHALECTTDNGEAELALANALVRKGRFDDAIDHFHRAMPHATDSAPYNNLARLLAQQGKLDEAIAELRQGLLSFPDSVQLHSNLGIALANQKRFDESRECFRRALEIDPNLAMAHRGLGELLGYEGKIEESQAEFDRAISLDPRDVAALCGLAQMLFNYNKMDESISNFEAALAVDPYYVPAHLGVARALDAQGRIGDAIAHYHQVLQIDPKNAAARQNLDQLVRENAELLKP